ncbi:AP-1 complex subunit mu [Sarotherodon galilaeus]
MEHYFRTALWMLFLIGCFQAAPISKVNKKVLGLKLLHKDVEIKIDGSEFYAPENIEKECFINALNCVTLELERTNKSEECLDPGKRIPQGLEVLDHIIGQLNRKNLVSITQHNSSKCNCQLWPEKNFTSFVDDIMSLLQKINVESPQ